MTDVPRSTLRLVTLALAIAAAITIAPFWSPLVLAAWVAALLQPVVHRFQRILRGQRRGAAVIVSLLVVVVLAPVIALTVGVIDGVHDLLFRLRAAYEGQEPISAVLLGGDGSHTNTFRDWLHLATRYPGEHVARGPGRRPGLDVGAPLARRLRHRALLVHGARPKSYRWMLAHAPIPHRAFTRLARAFHETGRGIIVSGGGTALVQGTTATITYVALGVPRAWLLGPLTAVASFVPAIGTGLVWIPLAIELAVTGDYARATAIGFMGAVVISLIDNFVRPLLARFGHLQLPMLVVLVSMIGGIAAFGAWGALLGPLAVRMAVEALEILRHESRKRVTSSAVALHDRSKRSPRSLERRVL